MKILFVIIILSTSLYAEYNKIELEDFLTEKELIEASNKNLKRIQELSNKNNPAEEDLLELDSLLEI